MGRLITTAMATRNTVGLPDRNSRSTDFQLYVGSGSNVIDFTRHRLLAFANKTKDLQQQMFLMALVEDYVNGLVAIAWKRGSPVHIKVTQDK